MPDPYFLSAENPVATSDQRDLERTALRLLERPEVQRARMIATLLWRNVMAYPAADQMSGFDNMIDEYVFNFVLRAVATDTSYPRILRLMQPAHRWFGHAVPGSRWGGDSPDFTYRMIAIGHGSRYVLRGRPTCEPPPSVTYTLMENMPSLVTVATLDSLDLAADADGVVEITIDETPADGRTNHIQTRPGIFHLLVRDAIGDWLTQTPYALTVERLGRPDRDPLSDEDLAREAARQILESVYYVYYCTQSGSGQAPNQVRAPLSSAPFGGMATQWGTKGNLDLAEHEALIVTANAAGALFRNVVLSDQFFMSRDYWSRTGSFNHTQMAPDADGLFTFVVAHRDPGIHNWLDTGGLRRLIFGHRWQAFDRSVSAEAPTLAARTVGFDALDRELPEGVSRIDSAGRLEQIARRQAGFDRRFIDR